MNIQTTIKPLAYRQTAAPKPQEQSQESRTESAADYLERSNDTLTPKLAILGGAFMGLQKGIQISEGMHPAAQVIWSVGSSLVGAGMGYAGGGVLSSVNSTVTNAVFGSETSLGKSLVSTGLNTAAFGLVGGWTGAAIHAVAAVGGAAAIARQDIINQG